MVILCAWMTHFNACKRSLGTVMVSQACVCLQGEGVGYPGHWISHMVGCPFPLDMRPGYPTPQTWNRSHGRVPYQTWDLDTLPPDMGPGYHTSCHWHLVVITGDLIKLGALPPPHPTGLIPNGGHQNTYGTHPTGMLSC